MGWSKSFHPQGFLNSLPAKRLATITLRVSAVLFRNQISSSFSDEAVDRITEFLFRFGDLLRPRYQSFDR
jgi:hypothetical protein